MDLGAIGGFSFQGKEFARLATDQTTSILMLQIKYAISF